MLDLIKKLYKKYEETVWYLFFGMLTVVFNTAVYIGLSQFLRDVTANSAAFILSVLFAYCTNSLFVFKDRLKWSTFIQFFGMRIGTILIDDFGLLFLIDHNCNKLIAKCIVNAIIIVLNYIFSKFFIFKKKEEKTE